MADSLTASPSPTPDERLSARAVEDCVRVLEAICADRTELAYLDLELRNRLTMAAGRVSRPDREEQRALSRAVQRKEKRELRQADSAVLAQAGIRQKRLEPVYLTPEKPPQVEAGGGTFQLGSGVVADAQP